MKPEPLPMMAGKAREEGVQELQEFGSSGAQIDNAGLRSYQRGSTLSPCYFLFLEA